MFVFCAKNFKIYIGQMEKFKSAIFLISFLQGIVFFFGCGNESPQNYFNIAVLNTNMLSGFAGNGFIRQLDSPSSKLSEDGQTTSPVSRSEIIKMKIDNMEENLQKVEDLKVTDDTKDIITSSKNLYNFVIPVLKNEYLKLAEMYDNGAPADQINSYSQSIQDKYSSKYKELYDTLIANGKAYAEKNNIKVNWGN